MKDQLIRTICMQMSDTLSGTQATKLQSVLISCLENVKIEPVSEEDHLQESSDFLKLYLASKKIEGCSEKTLTYYDATIKKMITKLNKDICEVTTDDLRLYLSDYQEENQTSRVTIDNIRRIISGFFGW